MPDPLRVLLVDDVAVIRHACAKALEASGRFTVVGEAENGAVGIRMADDLKPDIVLLDLSMPKVDGLEAIPRILGVSPLSKVVVLTGLDEDNVARQAKALGADAYLVKGLSLQHIVDRLTGVNWTLDTIGEQFDQLYDQIVSRRRELQE